MTPRACASVGQDAAPNLADVLSQMAGLAPEWVEELNFCYRVRMGTRTSYWGQVRYGEAVEEQAWVQAALQAALQALCEARGWHWRVQSTPTKDQRKLAVVFRYRAPDEPDEQWSGTGATPALALSLAVLSALRAEAER